MVSLAEPCLVVTNSRYSRQTWQAANGPIPPGLHVLHHCDNPPCRRLSHLYLGTRSDNMQDKIRRGRDMPLEAHPRLDRHGRAKLTSETVRAIRRRFPQNPGRNTGDHGLQALAKELGVTSALISQVVKGTIWKGVV